MRLSCVHKLIIIWLVVKQSLMALFAIHRLFDAFRVMGAETVGTACIENCVSDHAAHADNGRFSASLRRRILSIDQDCLDFGSQEKRGIS